MDRKAKFTLVTIFISLLFFGGCSSPIAPDFDSRSNRFLETVKGAEHFCGLESGGDVYCWETNVLAAPSSKLTSKASLDSIKLLKIPQGDRTSESEGFIDIDAGNYHTCGVTGSGNLYCWGPPSSALGDGENGNRSGGVEFNDSLLPIHIVAGEIDPADEFVSTELGPNHSCGVTKGGKKYCWGDGFDDSGVTHDEPILTEDPNQVTFNLQGGSWERDASLAIVGKLSGVQIQFDAIGSSYSSSVVTDSNGSYAISLPSARYHITASLNGYKVYSSAPGWLVKTDGSQVLNVFLQAEDAQAGVTPCNMVPPPGDGTENSLPPVVCIEASTTTAYVNETIDIVVTGEDDNGLYMVWWWGAKAATYSCGGTLSCIQQSSTSFSSPGTYDLCANARDVDYGVYLGEPHQASEGNGVHCVTITVLDSP